MGTELNSDLIQWIYERVAVYSSQIGIVGTPTVLMTQEELLNLPDTLLPSKMKRKATMLAGYAIRPINTMFINTDIHWEMKELEFTIIHELIHLRFPYLRHGLRYEAREQDIYLGKRYPIKTSASM